MTEFNELKRSLMEKGFTDDEFDDFEKECKRRIMILNFVKGKKDDQVIAYHNRDIVFIQFGHEDRVSIGDTWVCITDTFNGFLYATPLAKLTPGFLINLDSGLRDSIISELWLKHRKMFESEFAERYKQEITDSVSQGVDSAYRIKIKQLEERNAELEDMNRHNSFLMQNSFDSKPRDFSQYLGIELGSDDGIELGSDDGEELCIDTEEGELEISIPAGRAQSIPNSRRRTMPGFPEIRGQSDDDIDVKRMKFDVERTGDDTIFSESFTDLRYFIHISPSLDMLVIRPNEFGNAFGVNKTITLKGLGKLSPFNGRKRLNAEFSRKYDGLVVYL